VNTAGLVIALDGDSDLPALGGLLSRILEQAHDADTARGLLTAEWGSRHMDPLAPVLSVVSGGIGWSIDLGPGGSRPHPLSRGTSRKDTSMRLGTWQGLRELVSLESQLRTPRRASATAPRSVLLAGRGPDGPLIVLLGLGSAASAIVMRVWPGHTVAPPAGSIEAQQRRLSELAADVDALIARGGLAEAEVQSAIARARAAALAEGDHAEHQAQLMDSYGDDAGAAVRRLVAQSHAGSLAEAALRGLLDRSSGEASL
jgi:hypothetical protein